MSDLIGVALGGVIAAGSALAVVLVESRLRRGERDADLREQRRKEAAALVGPAIKSLRDLDPNANVGVLRGHPRAAEILKEKWAEWLTAQGGLEVLGAMHPDSEVSRLCESVIEGGTKLLGRLHFAITEREAQSEAWWDGVVELRENAMTDARSLVRAVLRQPA
jgi:hypothetical protein